MAHPPVVHRVVAKLTRSEIAGVNAHTIPLALERLERDNVVFDNLTERQLAIALLERVGYPENPYEFNAFMGVNIPFAATTLNEQEITDAHAPHYMRWVAPFLSDKENGNNNTQRNARTLLRWLVVNRQPALFADQTCLENMRRIADDEDSNWKSSAFIVYALGLCGTLEDYDRVIRHSERVIEHDRENIDLVAEALYRLYPPALINALQFFLEHVDASSKQFNAGLHLLGKVADIEDKTFWTTYYEDMDQIVNKLSDLAGHIPAIERILDMIEKHLALAYVEDEE